MTSHFHAILSRSDRTILKKITLVCFFNSFLKRWTVFFFCFVFFNSRARFDGRSLLRPRRQAIRDKAKFHLTSGHETVMAKAHLFSSATAQLDPDAECRHVEEIPAETK